MMVMVPTREQRANGYEQLGLNQPTCCGCGLLRPASPEHQAVSLTNGKRRCCMHPQDELHRARKAGKKGWLVKRGGSRHSTAYNSEGSPMTSPMLKSLFSRRNWKRRLFVLDDVGYLYYYKVRVAIPFHVAEQLMCSCSDVRRAKLTKCRSA
jgi:hypothetical protein